MRCFITCLIVSLLAVPALAGPPTIGVYMSPVVIDGTFSESWKGGQEGAAGNTINAASLDGMVLGGQWTLTCMVAIAQAQEIDRDMDAGGTGYVKYKTIYSGGPMWLSGSGPWGDGSENYTCTIYDGGMTVTVTHQFVMGTRISAVSDVTVGGVIDNYSNCFVYTLTNAAIIGAGVAPPGEYPEFQDENCATGTSVFGAWGPVDDITLAIYSPTDPECRVPAEEVTWGQIKQLYTD